MRSSISIKLLIAILIAASGAGGCSSASEEASDHGLSEPLVTVRQPQGQPLARPGESVDLNLQVDVYNSSSEPITIRRLSLSTLPTSDIQFKPAGRNLDETIAPKTSETIELWVRASNDSRRNDPMGPVQVRGTAVFDSAKGKFRTVFIENVVQSSQGWSNGQ